jgi:DNA-binding response OmpR family regulator
MHASSPHTLIVEDDADSAEILSKLMHRHGFESTCVATAGEAIHYLETQKPGNVILDLMLPDVAGTTVLEHIHSHNLPIRVAVVTAASAARTTADAVTLNPDALFIKPLDYSDLMAWLAKPKAA